MKKTLLLSISLTVILVLLSSFLIMIPRNAPGQTDAVEVLKNHCYRCHTAESGKISRSALNFDNWDEYSVTKKISKLNDICEEVEDGKMPPKKFLKKNPDKALSDKQKELICKWAASETEKLMESIQ